MDKKKVLKIVGIAVIALVVGVVAVLKSMDFNQYKGMIADMAKEATGRDLVISGDLSLALGLSPAVVVDGVSFSNAEWGSGPNMATIKRFEAEVALMPLFTGGVQVKRLILIEPNILLETNKAGEGNWVFTAPAKPSTGAAPAEPVAPAADGGGGLPQLDISEVFIQDAKLTYLDGKTGEKTSVALGNLLAEAGGMGDPISLSLKAGFNGEDIHATGTVGALSTLTAGEPYPIDLTVGSFGMDIDATAKGTLSNLMETPVADLRVSLTSKGSTLSGKVKAVVADRPVVTATLNSDHLDMAHFGGQEGDPAAAPAASGGSGSAAAPAAKAKKVFPSDPLPLAGLHAVDADVRLEVAELVSSGLVVKNIDVSVSLKKGLLKVSPLNAAIFGGNVVGSVTLDARKKTSAVLTAHTVVSKLQVGTMLKDMDLSSDIVGAPTDVTIDIKGHGKSVAEIMASSNGRILSIVGPGKIANKSLDIAGGDALVFILGALNPTSSKQEFTVLQCAVVNMGIKGGMGTLDKGIALETERMTVVGDGEINLASEGLDIALSTAAREGLGLNATSFAQAIKVGGTLAEPSPAIDLIGAAKTGMKVGTAIATGGLSLLTGALLDKVMADDTPCLTAQGKKAPPKKAAPKKQIQQKKAPADANPLNALKGLFGN